MLLQSCFFTYGVSNIVMSIPLYLCLLDTCPAEILELQRDIAQFFPYL